MINGLQTELRLTNLGDPATEDEGQAPWPLELPW
jgi:hypothetical protein